MFKILRNKKGVTLVELLAVVVILGIIAAIAVPTIGNLISNQQEKADIATLQNVVSSSKLYAIAEETDIFALSELDTEGYIDFTGYEFGILSATNDNANIWVKVDGTTVTFHSDEPANLADVSNLMTTIYVNDTKVTVSTMTVAP
jgi:type IV pilus assembly protein PilA